MQSSLRTKTCCRLWTRELSNSCCFFRANSWVTEQRSQRPARSLRGGGEARVCSEGETEAHGGAGLPRTYPRLFQTVFREAPPRP